MLVNKLLFKQSYQSRRSNKVTQRILKNSTKPDHDLNIVKAVLSSFDDNVKSATNNRKRRFDEIIQSSGSIKPDRISHLTETQQDQLQNEMKRYQNDDMEFRNCNGKIVKRISMRTLKLGRELNDEIINHFYSLLQTDSNKNVLLNQKIIFLNSYFIPALIDKEKDGYCFDKVKNWRFRRHVGDLFLQDKVIIPCHVNGNHWTCPIICIKTKKIHYLDPLVVKASDDIPRLLIQYLEDEWNAFGRRRVFNRLEWKVVKPGYGEIPRQTNNYDCGVYVCMYAYYVSRNLRINFLSRDIDIVRQRLAYSIMKQKICIRSNDDD